MSVLIVDHLLISCLCTCDRYPACCTVSPFYLLSSFYVFLVALFFFCRCSNFNLCHSVQLQIMIADSLHHKLPLFSSVWASVCLSRVLQMSFPSICFCCCPADTILRLILIKITCTPSSLWAFFFFLEHWFSCWHNHIKKTEG